MSVKKIPEGYNSVAPYLIVPDAAKAIEFYIKAFGASENMRLNMPDGSIGHAEIRIGDSIIMLGSANPEMGFYPPEHYKGSPVSIFLYVEDVDDFTSQATAAGVTIKQAPLDMFWGDRMAKLNDPFGYEWSVATHTEDVPLEEVQRRLYEQYSAAS